MEIEKIYDCEFEAPPSTFIYNDSIPTPVRNLSIFNNHLK